MGFLNDAQAAWNGEEPRPEAEGAWPYNPKVPCPVMEGNGWRRLTLPDGTIIYGPPRRAPQTRASAGHASQPALDGMQSELGAGHVAQ